MERKWSIIQRRILKHHKYGIVKNLFESGKSPKEIKDKTGFGNNVIYRALNENGYISKRKKKLVVKNIKLVCKQSFDYNFTQPYFQFRAGEIYEAIFHEGSYCYEFKFCNLVDRWDSEFRQNSFWSLEEWREIQLEKIFQ